MFIIVVSSYFLFSSSIKYVLLVVNCVISFVPTKLVSFITGSDFVFCAAVDSVSDY